MKIYGYIRVSSKDQNIARQLLTMKDLGLKDNQIFIDRMSGKDFNRPQYKKMINKLKEGDLIIVHSIDRFGRNYNEMIKQWHLITKEIKADIRVLDMPLLDTTISKDILGTLIADLVLQIFSYCAHEERVNIKQRQKEGIEAAKIRGVQFGKKPFELSNNFKEIVHDFENKKITEKEAVEKLSISRSTFYKYKRILKNNEINNTNIPYITHH